MAATCVPLKMRCHCPVTIVGEVGGADMRHSRTASSTEIRKILYFASSTEIRNGCARRVGGAIGRKPLAQLSNIALHAEAGTAQLSLESSTLQRRGFIGVLLARGRAAPALSAFHDVW